MKRFALVLVCVACLLCAVIAGCGGPAQPAKQEGGAAHGVPAETVAPAGQRGPDTGGSELSLYRDEWGVPHVYAKTAADAAYGLGYAQAEDRLDDIYKNVRLATGRMAEAFGEEHAELDYIVRLLRNAEVCQAYWDDAPEHIRAQGDAFMGGVMAYVADHPEKVPEFACDLYGWQCGAVARAVILQWPMGNLMRELGRKDKAPDLGSNGWAVSPGRSAEGCAILMMDPHLTWEGMQVFYEARVHCDEYEACGFYIVGSPLPALGHTAHVAWACTTGGPDTADVYMMKLDPTIPTVYEYDGEAKAAEIRAIVVPVKDAEPYQQVALNTINGPAIAEPDLEKGILYVGNTPYLEDVGLFEQMCTMVRARNCEEFYDALGMNHFMEQNVIFADRAGNIQYVRTGRTPIRPEGYNWSVPVPGNTSATRWQGIHGIEDLVQIKNPEQGYMQNCNVSPANMMKNSPMTPDKYPHYIYENASSGRQTPRGMRALALLAGDDSITKEEAMGIGMNVHDVRSKPWQKALRQAVEAVGAQQMEQQAFAKAVETILAWNGQFKKESAAAPIVKFWRLKCQDEIDVVAVAKGRPLAEGDQKRMLGLLAETLAEIEAAYGTMDITWGDVNWIGRGGTYFPCPGADFGGGKGNSNLTETLLCIKSEELPDQPGRYVGHVGSESMMLCFMHSAGIESYSCVMWGQSGERESAHYLDQAEKLYAQRRFKPTWFQKADLLDHIESERTLAIQ